jgi:hypothetical protein
MHHIRHDILSLILTLMVSVLTTMKASADTLQPLGDEFENAASFAQWQDIDEVEGWGVSSDESADINTTTPGHFRIVPKAMGWYMHLRGVLFFKEVSGDFIATTRLRVLSRHNPLNAFETPNRFYSLTGIFIHEPRPYITQAGPNPYRTDAVWPPAAFGSDYVPNTENYIFLSYGTAGNPGTRQFEIKTTRNSNSILYYNSTGIDQSVNEAWMQLIRVGNTVVCLRKYSENGQWIVENRYPNADHHFPAFGSTLQVGITAYTDWDNGVAYHNGGLESSWHANYTAPGPGNPDLISEVDYFRIQRPDPALTEAMLQAMVVSYNPNTNQTANPPVLLSASPAAAAYVGNVANIPLGQVAPASLSLSAAEGGSIDVVVTRSGASLDRALSMSYQTVAGTAGASDFTPVSGTLAWAPGDPAQKTITIPLTSDTFAEGSETFTLQLSNLDGPATFPASDPTQSVVITIQDHPFDQWRLTQFGADANSPSAAANADYDSDGVANLLENVFQTDPINGMNVASLPQAIIDDNRFGLRCVFPSSPGVRLEIQQSTTLDSWQTVANRSAGAGVWTLENPDFSLITGPLVGEIRVLAPAGVSPMFLRVSATQN